MTEISYFWLTIFSLASALSGTLLGMGFQLIWFLKNDMFRPEKYPKKPWWWRL